MKKMPLPPHLYREYNCGDTTALYLHNEKTGRFGLWLVPTSLRKSIPVRRALLTGVEVDGILKAMGGTMPAWEVDSLIQVKASTDDSPLAFSQGRTMRNSVTVDRLKFTGQAVSLENGTRTIRTSFAHSEDGWKAHHDLRWLKGSAYFESAVTIENTPEKPLTLEMLASFSLGGVTPFAADDAPGRLKLHRFRAVWSMEGRLETRAFEDLQLERSWSGYGVRAERFGDVGALPVCGFFPLVAVEDTGAGVMWGAHLAHPGTWQMEVSRRDDMASLTGGLGDREFGHWTKTLAPSETFTSPTAYLACVKGDIDDLCHALTSAQLPPLAALPASEKSMPVIFNEWGTSWGDPSHTNMVALAESLRGTGVKYLVMDAGWYKPASGGNWGVAQGEWVPSKDMYPDGIRATADAIRKAGLIPGLWFEMEVAGSSSELFKRTEWLLKRDGKLVTVGPRRFLDLRIPAVGEYLAVKVIGTLREAGFGYLKIDYNENIGPGVDGADSIGENLRQHLMGVQAFIRRIRKELPELVIENCSSGGHRLEPSMMAITAMGSFSDAHECPEIPVIAANLQRLIQPQQSQIWAVMRSDATLRRTNYLVTAGFLGRLCLSGDFVTLTAPQRAIVQAAIDLYRVAAPVIKRGRSWRYGPDVLAYRHAEGWQGVVRLGANKKQLLVVGHTFAKPGKKSISLPLPPGRWRVVETLQDAKSAVKVKSCELAWTPGGEWSGMVTLLKQ